MDPIGMLYQLSSQQISIPILSDMSVHDVKDMYTDGNLSHIAASSTIVNTDEIAPFHTRSKPGHSLTDIRVKFERPARVTDIYRCIGVDSRKICIRGMCHFGRAEGEWF